MEHAFGLDIPRTLEEVCDPKRMALVVYDMQVGIMSQLPKERGEKIIAGVATVLQAARAARVRVFFFSLAEDFGNQQISEQSKPALSQLSTGRGRVLYKGCCLESALLQRTSSSLIENTPR